MQKIIKILRAVFKSGFFRAVFKTNCWLLTNYMYSTFILKLSNFSTGSFKGWSMFYGEQVCLLITQFAWFVSNTVVCDCGVIVFLPNMDFFISMKTIICRHTPELLWKLVTQNSPMASILKALQFRFTCSCIMWTRYSRSNHKKG